MRITGGKLKGKALVYPRSGLRPTKEVTRQAIFNVLGRRVEGARVCDIFAGGGALGIEAISRGAREAIFIEKDPVVFRYLKENVSGLDGIRIIRGDVFRILPRFKGGEFDIVFADPPYGRGWAQSVVEMVFKFEILTADGILVLEHGLDDEPQTPEGGIKAQKKRYGDSVVTFFRRRK